MNKWAEIDVFDDSDALAEDLRVIAGMVTHKDAYILREAADNLDGMWRLLNDLLRLKNEEGLESLKQGTAKAAKSKAKGAGKA